MPLNWLRPYPPKSALTTWHL